MLRQLGKPPKSKRGGGGALFKARPLRKKNFFEARKKTRKTNVATKLEGGGVVRP